MRHFWMGASVIAAAVLGFAGAKLQTRATLAVAARAQTCFEVSCEHLNLRTTAIVSQSQQIAAPRYLAIGDSITERAALPDLCGRHPINAGVGGATVRTFTELAPHLADVARPDFVIIALGANDAGDGVGRFASGMQDLTHSLAGYPILLVPIPEGSHLPRAQEYNSKLSSLGLPVAEPLPKADTIDGVHLTGLGYHVWKQALKAAAGQAFCPEQVGD